MELWHRQNASRSHKPFIYSFQLLDTFALRVYISDHPASFFQSPLPCCLPNIYELLRDTSARTLKASLYASNRAFTRVLSDTNASSSNSRSANKSGLYSDVTSLCWIASLEKLTYTSVLDQDISGGLTKRCMIALGTRSSIVCLTIPK